MQIFTEWKAVPEVFSVKTLNWKKKKRRGGILTYPKSSLAAAKIVDVFPVPGGP